MESSESDREADIRARIQQHWEASESGAIDLEHAIYAADAILDYPQSGERFTGRSRIQAQRSGHPAKRHFTIRRILGRGDLWSGEGSGYRAWLDSKPRRRGQFYRRPVFALAIWVGLLADVTSIAAFHP